MNGLLINQWTSIIFACVQSTTPCRDKQIKLKLVWEGNIRFSVLTTLNRIIAVIYCSLWLFIWHQHGGENLIRSICSVDRVHSRVGLGQRHKEVNTCSHSKKCNCSKHNEASPEDQLGDGEAAALQLLCHISILHHSAPVLALSAHRHIAIHQLGKMKQKHQQVGHTAVVITCVHEVSVWRTCCAHCNHAEQRKGKKKTSAINPAYRSLKTELLAHRGY